MNSNNEDLEIRAVNTPHSLMRLVDGELSPVEQCELLRSLDSQPDGWRRCALAFLEDQAWRQELTASQSRSKMAAIEAACPTTVVQTAVQQQLGSQRPGFVTRRPRGNRMSDDGWGKTLVLAATVLAAFLFGLTLPTDQTRSLPPQSQITNAQPVAPVDDRRSQPYYVSDSDFWDRDSAVPLAVQESLRQRGTDVRRQRGLVPMQLPDGRRVTVPYEDVQLVPVRGTSY